MAELWHEGRQLGIDDKIAKFSDTPRLVTGPDVLFPSIMGTVRLREKTVPIYLATRPLSPETDAKMMAGQKIVFQAIAEHGDTSYVDPRTLPEVQATLSPGQVLDHNTAFKIPKGSEGFEAIFRGFTVQAIQYGSAALLEQRAANITTNELIREHGEKLKAYGLGDNTPDDQERLRGALRFGIETILSNPRSFFDGLKAPEPQKAVEDFMRLMGLVERAASLPQPVRDALLNKERTHGPAAVWGAYFQLDARQRDVQKRMAIVQPKDSRVA